MTQLRELDISRWDDRAQDIGGSAFGYHTMYEGLIAELATRGIKHRDGAGIRFEMPFYDARERDREEWIYALAEIPKVPKRTAARVQQADHLMVPNDTVASWFRDAGIDRPMHECPLGFEPSFVYRERDPDPPVMRFLWVGAFSNRKMWIYALHAFWQAFDPNDMAVELYIKTTFKGGRAPSINRMSNVVFDTRVLSRTELLDLYYSAHVFVHPSPLEGFGLPPLEAMGTGATVMSVSEGGLTSFVSNDTAELIPTVRADMIVRETVWMDAETAHMTQDVVRCWKPNREALAAIMKWTRDKYRTLARKRRDASDWAHQHFSWPVVADRWVEVLEEHSDILHDRYVPRADIEDVPHKTLIHIFDPVVMEQLPDPVPGHTAVPV